MEENILFILLAVAAAIVLICCKDERGHDYHNKNNWYIEDMKGDDYNDT